MNNAARTRFGPPNGVTDDDFQDAIDTNLRGPFFASVAANELMQTAGAGAIINISSCAATLMVPDHAVYTMTKTGLEGLTRQMAIEFAPAVRVNAIAPGPTATERNFEYDPRFSESWQPLIPLGRVGTVDDLLGPTIFLASDAARFLTGQVLHVDGGWTLRGQVPNMTRYDYTSDRQRG